MRDEGVIYVAGHPLLNGDVRYSLGVSASEMTYIVSGGALNSTHSLAADPRVTCLLIKSYTVICADVADNQSVCGRAVSLAEFARK